MTRRNIELKLFGLIVGLAAIVLVMAAIGLVAGAHHADTREQRYEQALVAEGIAQRKAEIQTSLNPFVIWDEAIIKIDNRFDRAWIRQNIGASITANLGFPTVFILDGKDAPIYGRRSDQDVATSEFGRLAAAANPLIARVRAIEADKTKMAALHAVHVTDVDYLDGAPVVLTVSLIKPDLNARLTGARAPLLVTGAPVSRSIVAAFSRRYRLDRAHIEVGNGDHRRAAAVTMGRAPDHRPIALVWTPRRPGAELLRFALPLLGLTVVVVAISGGLLFRMTRRAAKRLLLSEAEAKHRALHDPLTGLANRVLFNSELNRARLNLGRRPSSVALLCIDLDRFKEVNDSFGHKAGDIVIAEVARRLKAACRANDTVARLGGDEFAVIMMDATPEGAATLAGRIVQVMQDRIDVSMGLAQLGCSIGVSIVQDPEVLHVDALRQADVALYRAKQAGRNRFTFFEPEMDSALRLRKSLEKDLRATLDAEAITVAYQPLVDCQGRRIGVEALARWTHPERGVIAPAIFIPLAESCGLIEALGVIVLRQAARYSRRHPGLDISVNVSALQLSTPSFTHEVSAIFAETGALARNFTLEITETCLLGDDAATRNALRRLKAVGFKLALDDFGTGYSSLAYLRLHPIDKLKIDRSFVSALPDDATALSLTKALIGLAKSLDLKVTAEGVETEAQMAALVKLGCDEFQGYLFGRPVEVFDEAGCEA